MLIKTKYIDCASKSIFNKWKLPTSASDVDRDIYWSAIVFIKDTGEIWTHGKLYGGLFSNADNNKVSLAIGGTQKILALDGHVQSYNTLTGSGTIADQVILSTGESNKWTLKTLGKNAFSNENYLPLDATAIASEKVVHPITFKYNENNIYSFDGSESKILNFKQGDNVTITGDSQGNITISSDPGTNTVDTAGATNLINKKLFLIGAESQTASPKTYSNESVYIGTDNCLYSGEKKVLTDHQSIYGLDIQTLINSVTTKISSYDPKSSSNSFTLVQGNNITLTPDATNKKITISGRDTTYDFYNLIFKQGDTIVDTYKPATSPNKTIKAGSNITIFKDTSDIIISSSYIDTLNTAGSTNKSDSKLYLIGTLSQSNNPQTYSNANVYIGTNNKLYSNNLEVSTIDHTHAYLPLAGGTLSGQLVLNGIVTGEYNNGIRINRDSAGWSSIIFGGPNGQTSGHDGVSNWFVATNPSSVFIINPISSAEGGGLDLYRNGDAKWRGSTILTADKINSQVGGTKNEQLSWATWNSGAYGGAIQIRELHYVNSSQSAWDYAPAITFHWGGRHVQKFGVRSDGQFAVDDVPISLSTHTHDRLTGMSGGTPATSPDSYQMLYQGRVLQADASSLPTVNNANGVLTFNTHPGYYYGQLGFSGNGRLYHRSFDNVALDTATAWNNIAFISDIPSWSLNATKPSYTYTEVGAAAASHTHSSLTVPDTRSVVSVPQDLPVRTLQVDFKASSSVDNPSTTANVSYSHIISFAGWDTNEPSGGWPSQLSIGDGIAVRQATSATTWGVWRNLYHTGNFNPANYLPLTGGTLTGELTLSIPGINTDNFIKFKNDNQNCYFGIRNPYGSFGLTFVSPDGTYNKVWHSGNLTNLNQLTTRNFSDLQNKPTTLSGYGITDFTSHIASNPLTPENATTNAIGYFQGVAVLGQGDGGIVTMYHSPDWQSQIFQDFRTGQLALRGKNYGTWTDWRIALDSSNYSSYAVQARTRGNWNDTTVVNNVVGQLAWKAYGNEHTIFDASNGFSPSGTSCSTVNSAVAWSSTYPTLMGWNGYNTYGVRVDTARYAESAAYTTKLKRRDSSDNYFLQHHWTGEYWYLRGYLDDNFHAEVQVGYANNAGNADTLDGYHNGNLLSRYVQCPYVGNSGTVGSNKQAIIDYFNTYSGNCVGTACYVGNSIITQWNSDSASYYPSSAWSFIKISGSYGDMTYGTFLCAGYADANPMIIGRYENNWTSWHTLAYLDSNVASATKLQTARTINGVPFDGTSNITITAAASDVYSWAKASVKPTYSYSEVGALNANGQNVIQSWNNGGGTAYSGAFQIRERDFVTSTQSSWEYAPSISFHWGGRVVKRFGITANGDFAVDDVPILHSGNYNSYVTKSYIDGLGVNGVIPIGGIIMWSGSIDTIPSGWTLCNGSNGTPDLSDRFVMGASIWLAPGNTGGSNTTYLTAKQLPSHSHAYTTTSDDEDNGFTFTGDDGVSRYYNRYSNRLSPYQGRGSDGNNNSTGLYRTSPTGSGYAIENRPAYYALAFIMRIS